MYGGTKAEMQRLLADASKLAGTKFDINNLNDVFSAIHIIQNKLGVTGTTALEAKETISGSFNAMKSAAENLVANLALGRNVKQSFKDLSKTTETFVFGNLLPSLGNMTVSIVTVLGELINASIKGIIDIAPKILPALGDFINQVIIWGAENWHKFLEEGIKWVGGIVEGVITTIPVLNKQAISLVTSVISTLASNLPLFLKNGWNMVLNLINGIIEKTPEIIDKMTNLVLDLIDTVTTEGLKLIDEGFKLIGNMIEGIIKNLPDILKTMWDLLLQLIDKVVKSLPKFLAKGGEIIDKMIKGIADLAWKIIEKMGKVISDVINEITKIDWIKLGKDIIEGMVKGIAEVAWKIWDTLKNAISGAWQKVLKFFGIASPSKKFKWVSEMNVEGMVVGMKQGKSKLAEVYEDAMPQPSSYISRSDLKQSLDFSNLTNLANISPLTTQQPNFNQNITINAPQELNPSEVARQTRNATRQLVLDLGVNYG